MSELFDTGLEKRDDDESRPCSAACASYGPSSPSRKTPARKTRSGDLASNRVQNRDEQQE
jgi:hypothetical protein